MEKVILLKYHMMAFAAGFVLDLIIGDPENWSHPVRWIGSLIAKLTNRFLNRANTIQDPIEQCRTKRRFGRLFVLLVILISGTTTAVLLLAAYFIHPILGCALEAWITFRLLATKSLRDASMNVYRALTEENSTLDDARYAVSMIVGRDTAALDEIGVTKAAVETVAENTSDGIIAPMLYTAIGGPILGIIYKSINTMDSMVAYRNEKYIDFGRAAAMTDDIANFLPARISGILMIAATGILGLLQKLCHGVDDESNNEGIGGRVAGRNGEGIGGCATERNDEDIAGRYGECNDENNEEHHRNDTFHYSASNALRIFRRDRRKHASPNAAHTEAVCAGALSIELAGDASYFGEIHHKPTLGDPIRPIESEDIIRANRLMLGTAIICEFLCLTVMALILIFRN